jgi:predicted TIM-barrel fold metal-dependent hydrolase
MGLAGGIFVVDTHVFAQRFAFNFKGKGMKPDVHTLTSGGGMAQMEPYDNSERLLYHMDRYGVDVCVIQSAFGMTNEINRDIAEKHPNRFIALCRDAETQRKAQKGEAEWTIEAAAKEIDEKLSTGLYKGIGEGLPRDRRQDKKRITWDERLEQICQIMELGRKYKVPIQYHTGLPNGFGGEMNRAKGHYETCDNVNPLLCHEVAALYPDVSIILGHGGIEGNSYYIDEYEKCLNVAASHPNVYIETGQWWAELYEKPLKDPNIGAEKLIFGTGWGSALIQSWMPGCVPETCFNQELHAGPPAHQTDFWGWCLRELGRLNIPQDDLNLILGGNAVKVYGIQTPFTRLFKDYPKKQK